MPPRTARSVRPLGLTEAGAVLAGGGSSATVEVQVGSDRYETADPHDRLCTDHQIVLSIDGAIAALSADQALEVARLLRGQAADVADGPVQ